MAEISLPWTDGGGGDDGPYSADNWKDMWEMLFKTDEADEGVVKNFNNELAGTQPLANTVRIDTGGACNKGGLYRNTASVDVTIPTPAASTRIDRVVLRKSWGATQTIRITRVAGVEGAAAPALTQVDGTTWDIPLYQASITTGGTITLTDQREWLHFGTRIGTTNIDDDAVTEAKQADGTYVPIGGIILWSGAVGAIPANWQLCDGTGGTPDLQDKFVVGAGSGYAVGASGGAATHTHAVNIASDLGGAHDHGGFTGWWYSSANTDVGVGIAVVGDHQHAIPTSSQHQHGVNGNTGSGSTLPPYYALCYIMRTA
jgi:hypothetical protein